jgi:activator of HSP90 ATPase
MALSSLETSTLLFAPPSVVFDLWLDALRMGLIMGGPANIDGRAGGHYSLFDGAVVGEFVFLERPKVIAQTWRTHDFTSGMDDARLELSFGVAPGGTHLRAVQTHVPPTLREQFLYGWDHFVFPRLRDHFTSPEM